MTDRLHCSKVNQLKTRVTLAESIFGFVEKRQTHTEAFKVLLEWYGREKVRKLYESEKLKRQETRLTGPRLNDHTED